MTDAQARLKAEIAEEVARSHGCSMSHGYGEAHKERFLRDAERILALLSRTPDAQPSSTDEVERLVEQEISAWAFSHNIDGAIRNELFARIRAAIAAMVTK